MYWIIQSFCNSAQFSTLLTFFLHQVTSLLGALQTIFGWNLGLFDGFTPSRDQRSLSGIEPLTVQSLN